MNDWAQLILVLGLYYEITKGRDGYWYPFLRQLPQDLLLPSSWSDEDIEMIQDDFCIHQIKKYNFVSKMTWLEFKQVLESNKEIFNEKLRNENLFLHLYAQVCTRCFGYQNETAALVPMADNFNHNSVSSLNEMICLSLLHNGKHRIEKYSSDYSEVFRANGWSKKHIDDYRLNIKGRFNR